VHGVDDIVLPLYGRHMACDQAQLHDVDGPLGCTGWGSNALLPADL